MAIRLQKGQTINLSKDQYDLSQVTIGLGWAVRKKKTGFLASLFKAEEDYDLDAIAFLLNQDHKVESIGNKLISGDVIFYNSLTHKSGSIWLTGDNRTGSVDGDDEQIVCLLDKIPQRYHSILILVSIYKGTEKQQHFGMVENAFIRAVDAKGTEMARYDLSTDSTFNGMRSMIFAELYRKDSGWKFRALGDPEKTDSFVEILKRYMV